MSKKKASAKVTIPSAYRHLLEMKQGAFEKIASDVHELYERGRFRMHFIGPTMRVSMSEEDGRILQKKYKLSTKRELSEDIKEVVRCIHYVLCEEVEIVAGKLPTKASENLKKKTSFISKLLEKDPSIRDSFHTYSFSIVPFFSGISWEAEMRVFRSPHEFIGKTPTLPVGRIQIQTYATGDPYPELITTEFEITSKDVKDMIKHLGDLDKALENLRTAKITPGK